MEWFIENILTLVSMLFVATGGFFALSRWKKANNLQRAKFIEQIIEKLRFDKDMADALYLVEYDQDWYDDKFHGGSDKEFLIDKFLSYLTYICYLLDTKNISKGEKKIVAYGLSRAFASYPVKAYLWNLYCFTSKREIACTFQYLIDYGINHTFLEKSDFNKDCDKYPKRLNF